MTAFIALCGVLVVATLVALIAPLLSRRAGSEDSARASNSQVYRDQLAELDAERAAGRITAEQWAAAAEEVERRVLEDADRAQSTAPASRSAIAATVVGVLLPVSAVALYIVLGAPEALSPTSVANTGKAHAVTPEQIEQMVVKLAARLEGVPDDVEGWTMLARAYRALGRESEALVAYRRLTQLRPNDAQLLADHADMLALSQGRTLRGEPEALIGRALAADPDNVKALALAGSAAFERGDYGAAMVPWQRALSLVPKQSDVHTSISGAIADAQQRLGKSAGAPPAAPASAAASDVTLQGRVELPAALAAKRKPEDAVFVFARPASGPRMPLAVVRKTVRDLPFEFRLDDSMAMTPETKLSQFKEVIVVARISSSGSATAQQGDLEAVTAPLAAGSQGLVLNGFREIEAAR